ncbi:unnamed protein product [Scytosiphon promiscuus]
MCIFCERAKASLDDPLADFTGGGGWDARTSTSTSGHTRSTTANKSWEASLQQKREAERCEELKRKARLPVTVITGFLGAGKTTFVNHLLSARHGRKLAVIENEFGEVAIDDALLGDGGVERGEEAQQVILMPNGCMCCRVRGDLVDALKRLIISAKNASAGDGDELQEQHQEDGGPSPSLPPDGAKHGETSKEVGAAAVGEKVDQIPARAVSSGSGGISENTASAAASSQTHTVGAEAEAEAAAAAATKLDGIILECSGLDELAPVLQTFFADPFVQEHVRLDAVVCLCDSPRLLRELVAPPPPPSPSAATIGAPISADGDAIEKASSMVREGDQGSSDGRPGEGGGGGGGGGGAAAANLVMSQLALSDRVLLNKSDLITPAEGEALVDAVKKNFPGASVVRCERGKVDVGLVLGVDSFSLDKALEMDQHFADVLADRKRNEEGGSSTHHSHQGSSHGSHRRNGSVEAAAVAPPLSHRRHGHDRLGAQSVGVELAERPIDWAKFTSWLKSFLEKEGEELIWRMKGVLWTAAAPGQGHGSSGAATTWGWGAGRRTVVQGLYGHFESEVSDWPPGATRLSRMVFIGDLSPRVQEALRAGVRSCVAAPRARPPPPKPRTQRSSAGRDGGGSGGGGAFASRLGSVKFGGGGGDDLFL